MNGLPPGVAAADGDMLNLALKRPGRVHQLGADQLCGFGGSDTQQAKGRWTPYRPCGRHVGNRCCFRSLGRRRPLRLCFKQMQGRGRGCLRGLITARHAVSFATHASPVLAGKIFCTATKQISTSHILTVGLGSYFGLAHF